MGGPGLSPRLGTLVFKNPGTRPEGHVSFSGFVAGGHAQIPDHLAPSAEDFLSVLKAVRSGKSFTETIKQDKFAKMVGALGDAVRARTRQALEGASSVSIQQDVRKAQLLIQFSCSDVSLNYSSGVLGRDV
jgi:hypothetical protein